MSCFSFQLEIHISLSHSFGSLVQHSQVWIKSLLVLFKVCNIFQTFKLNFATMPIDVMIFHFDLSATYCNIIYQYWYLVASLFQLLQTKVDKYNYERWHFTFYFLLSQNLERWYLKGTKKRSKSWNNWKIKYVTLHTKLWKSIPLHFFYKIPFQASSSNGEILVTEQEKSFTVDEEPWYYDRC